MKSRPQLIAEEALTFAPHTVVDIGYAQQPNSFFGGAKVYGVDIVEAAAPYDKTFKCDLNVDKLPFKKGEIDVVTMGCTLAHVAHPLRLLADIHRILKPGGVLILSSPNPNYYWENILNIFYNYFKKRVAKAKHVEHFFEFSRYNMRTITGRAGFQMLREVGFQFQLIKTPWRFDVMNWPGIAYEIIYVCKKVGAPDGYAIFEPATGGIERVTTNLFS